MDVMDKKKPFACSLCDERFGFNFALSAHIREVHQPQKVAAARAKAREKNYRCDICGKAWSDSNALKLHRRIHTGEKPYKCMTCGKCFRTTTGIRKHTNIHTGLKPYSCRICEDIFRLPFDLKLHMKRYHPGEEAFKCEICGAKYDNKKLFNLHCKEHGLKAEPPTQPVQYIVTVNIDPENEMTEVSLPVATSTSYIIEEFPEENFQELTVEVVPTTSEIDDGTATTLEEFLQGKKLKTEFEYPMEVTVPVVTIAEPEPELDPEPEPEPEPVASPATLGELFKPGKKISALKSKFPCAVCGENFLLESWLAQHMKTTHPEFCEEPVKNENTSQPSNEETTDELADLAIRKPFKCHVCGKRFKSNIGMKKHMPLFHPGEDKYKCDICGQGFEERTVYNRHVRSQCGQLLSGDGTRAKYFQCSVCGKGWKDRHALKLHERVHTGEKPYKCTTCGKCFRTSFAARKHVRIHTGQKSCQCYICAKMFRVPNDLVFHMKKHHPGEIPFRCDFCGEKFHRKSVLNQHRKAHMNEVQKNAAASADETAQQNENAFCFQLCEQGRDEFKCRLCDEMPYTSERDFKLHLLTLHPEVCMQGGGYQF